MGGKHSAATDRLGENRMGGEWKARGDEISPWNFLVHS